VTSVEPWPPALLQNTAFPLPVGGLTSRVSPAVVVGTPSPHPADLVRVLIRRDGGSPLVLRALREIGARDDPTQWFRAQLPGVEPGQESEYRVEWMRAGRQVAALPADGSWIQLRGASATSAEGPVASSDAPQQWPSEPRFKYGMEFFAALTINLEAEPIGATPEGFRINFYVLDGRVKGPGIDAVVIAEGGDWMCIRPDGVGMVNIKIAYRTSDGALILEQAGGVFDTGSDGYAQVAAGTLSGTPPFYATPIWSTAHPRWMWLNRKQGFGFGRVVMAKLQVQCDLYLPVVETGG
jgi:hypothetical protein